MSHNQEIGPGDVVQISPATCNNPAFAGHFLIVTELKSFGVMGYVRALGTRHRKGGLAYYRAAWEEIELIGKAKWIADEPDE